jgi:transcriptional regulator with XRE-family HTH domain
VPERGGPNLARRRRLAAELRRLREDAGFTGDEATERLGWPSSSKLSRIELGRTGLKQPDLECLLDLYGVAGKRREDLVALAKESRRAGLAGGPGRGLPGEHVAMAENEADAESISIWEPQLAPGLFQIESYARALFEGRAAMFSIPPGEIDRRIETRRLRQQVLTRKPPPLLTVVIDESVLRRKVGDASVMREQLQHIADLSELPHIDLRILPLDGEHTSGPGPFNYLRFRRVHAVPRVDIVAVEHLTGTQYVEDETDTYQYSVVFDSLLARALGGVESRELLLAAVGRWSS